MSPSDLIPQMLTAAMHAQDTEAFEDALNRAFRAGLSPDLSDILTSALLMSWHSRHEDVALALQELKAPASVDALFAAAFSRHEYLDYDEFFGLARKCTWALADIGSREAKDRLLQLAHGANAIVAAYAQKRLDHWKDELHRKGG